MTLNAKSRFPLTMVIFFSLVAAVTAAVRHWPEDNTWTLERVVPVGDKADLLLQYKRDGDETRLLIGKTQHGRAVWETSFENVLNLEDSHNLFYSNSVDSETVLEDRFVFPLIVREPDGKLRQFFTAVRLTDGKVLWRTPVNTSVSQQWFYSRVIEDVLLVNAVSVFEPAVLYCIEVQTGKIRWRKPGLDEPASPIAAEGRLFLHNASGKQVRIYDLKTGEYQDLSIASVGITANGEYYYVMPRQDEKEPWKMGAFNFSANEKKELFLLPDFFPSSLGEKLARFVLYKNTVVYPYKTDDEFGPAAVDLTTGQARWRAPLEKQASMSILSSFCGSNQFRIRHRGVLIGRCNDLLFYRPEADIFYRAEAPWIPIPLNTPDPSAKGGTLTALNLETGELKTLLKFENLNYSIARFGKNYLIAQETDSDFENVRFLELNGTSGVVERELVMSSPIEDRWTHKNIFYRLFNSPESVTGWKNVSPAAEPSP